MKQDKAYIDIKGVILLIILCASWGLNQVAIKVCIAGIPPVLQAGIRSTCSALIVLLWMSFQGQSVFEKDGTIWWGILAGIVFSVQFILLYWGLEFTNASRAVLILNTAPFVVALGTQLFVKTENLTRIQILGLIMAFSGIVVAFNESLNLPTREMLIGDIMLLGAAMAWGSGTVLIKASPLTKISPSKVLLYQLWVSAPILLITSMFLGEGGILDLNYIVMGTLIYQIIWIAFITYVVWFWLIRTYQSLALHRSLFSLPFSGLWPEHFFSERP